MPKAKISSFILPCNIYSGFCQVRYEVEKQITKIANRHHTIIWSWLLNDIDRENCACPGSCIWGEISKNCFRICSKDLSCLKPGTMRKKLNWVKLKLRTFSFRMCDSFWRLCWLNVFSCPGSSIPDLGEWVTESLSDWLPL